MIQRDALMDGIFSESGRILIGSYSVYKICYFVPESHLGSTKAALFSAGAGRIGLYEQCCWQIKGRGQFLPLTGSQPALGVVQELTEVDEYKVELVCVAECLADAIQALRDAHPYEEPALEILKLVDESSIVGAGK